MAIDWEKITGKKDSVKSGGGIDWSAMGYEDNKQEKPKVDVSAFGRALSRVGMGRTATPKEMSDSGIPLVYKPELFRVIPIKTGEIIKANDAPVKPVSIGETL